MSFDKDYPNRKDKRKPYRGSRQHTRSCRNGGSCEWCRENRTIATLRLKQKTEDDFEQEGKPCSMFISG